MIKKLIFYKINKNILYINLYKNAFFKKYFSLVNYITKIKFLMELVEKPKLNKFEI